MKNRKFFDEITDRTGTHSIKWDRVKEGGLAMWIADMDFATAPSVVEAMQERLNHPLFGYYGDPDRYFNAIFTVHIRNGGKTDIIFLLIRNGLYLQPA